MVTGTLYRPAKRNAHGDPINAAGDVVHVGSDGTEVGTITGLILGGPSWRPASMRGDVVDTTGLVGIPVAEAVQPAHGDLLVVDGIRYRVQGPPQWASRGLVQTPPRYRWWTVAATAN